MYRVKIHPNYTDNQGKALKKLKENNNLHISVSDKCSEFVIMPTNHQIQATEAHLSNENVYRKLPMPSDDKAITKSLNTLTVKLENKVNGLFREICMKRKLPDRFYNFISSHHTVLPVAYVTIKTHKYQGATIEDVLPEELKVRPIISGCNGPFDKMFWLLCHILSPLMNEVPSHLSSTHQFLQRLNNIPKEDLKGQMFYTADVEALYTNINIGTAIDNVMEMASEHKHLLCLFGMELCDIQQLLELTLDNSFFRYNKQVYMQLLGLFMGSRPAPLLAVIRMYNVEKRSIYIDLRLAIPLYGRYIDDLGSTSTNSRRAQLVLNNIEKDDNDSLIKLTLDFPSNKEQYTPFLNVEIKIDDDGTPNTRLFRKPQKKLLTLHSASHHPAATKQETVKNMYKTARDVSSNHTNEHHSIAMVDTLLRSNGYNEQEITKLCNKKKSKKGQNKNISSIGSIPIVLPYYNEETSAQIRRAINKSGLSIRPIFKPGKKLKDVLTRSRPLDSDIQCPNNKCYTCECLNVSKDKCTARNSIYKITCTVSGCNDFYIGETYRPLSDRFTEHYRNAKNPSAKSYINKPFAQHYKTFHIGIKPSLKLEILDYGSTIINRKIKEARLISKYSPKINQREELSELQQYLVDS